MRSFHDPNLRNGRSMTVDRLFGLAIVLVMPSLALAGEPLPKGWTTKAPRDEIRPQFRFEAGGGPNGQGCFVIGADDREGLVGYWEKTYPVEGGHYYRFSSLRRTVGVETPRRVGGRADHLAKRAGAKSPPRPAFVCLLSARRTAPRGTRISRRRQTVGKRLDRGFGPLSCPAPTPRGRWWSFGIAGNPTAKCNGPR